MKINLDNSIGAEELDKKKKFFEDQQNINAKLEKDIEILDQTISELSVRLTREELNRVQFQDELGGLRRTVERTSHDLEKARSELGQLKKNIADKRQQYELNLFYIRVEHRIYLLVEFFLVQRINFLFHFLAFDG